MFSLRAFICILVISMTSLLSGQEDKSRADERPIDQLNLEQIEEYYGPLFSNSIQAEMIQHGVLHKLPGNAMYVYDMTIPSGATVEAFNFINDFNCWLVKYDGKWGFLSNFALKSIGENRFEGIATEFSKPPKLLTELKPEYPKELKKRGIGGKVVVRVCIDKEGNVTKSMIRESIPELNRYALEAIHKCKFQPAMTKDGEPLEICIDIAINFE